MYSLNNIKEVSSQYSDSATLIIVTVVYIQFKLVQKQSPPSAVECVLYSCPQTGRIKIAVAIYLNFSNPHRRRRNHQYLCSTQVKASQAGQTDGDSKTLNSNGTYNNGKRSDLVPIYEYIFPGQVNSSFARERIDS